jgi:hypothetical protein
LELLSIREVADEFGLNDRRVTEMLKNPVGRSSITPRPPLRLPGRSVPRRATFLLGSAELD